MRLSRLLLALALAAAPVRAQEPGAPAPVGTAAQPQGAGTAAVNAEANRSLTGAPQGGEHGVAGATGQEKSPDIIMPHITDSHEVEIPWMNREGAKPMHLPRWAPVQIGGLGLDVSPTKHVVMLLLAATLCAVTLITAGSAHKRHQVVGGRRSGFAGGIEATVLFVRDEVILKNVGHHGEGYVPFLLTMFFFILFANMLGLIPFGSTATGNISVTATLAILAFLVIEIGGMRTLGKAYWSTIFYWPSDMKFGAMKIVLFLILTPVELLGKFTKPFALAIRLFANMTAGHVIVLAFIGMIFTFKSVLILPAPLLMAVAIMLLEVFVALLQAYIFTLLTSVFIGQIREAHH